MNYNSPSGTAARSIRLRLADRSESIEALAEATGIAHSTLKRRLKGLSAFTIDELDLIAQHFCTDLPSLLRPPFAEVPAKVSA